MQMGNPTGGLYVSRCWALGLTTALLAGGGVPGDARTARAQSLVVPSTASTVSGMLPKLVGETVAQIDVAYRRKPTEKASRRAQLDAVVSAWRAAPRSAANDRRLIEWLRMAIRKSMPGSREPLPGMPEFDRPATPSESTAAPMTHRLLPMSAAPSHADDGSSARQQHKRLGQPNTGDPATAATKVAV